MTGVSPQRLPQRVSLSEGLGSTFNRSEKMEKSIEAELTCPACGSDCNERDELTKAEREIERLRNVAERADAELADLRQACREGWRYAAELDDERKRLQAELDALRKDAERYRWLRDNPLWSVTYRLKQKTGNKEWRMRCDGELWGAWWPTHEQAVDHAMTDARAAVGAA